jgi:hypothetical protein
MSANRTNKFAFLDEGEAIRLLGVDRDTLLTFVREKRLRSYPGVGKGHFFRVSDLEKLASELNPAPVPEPEIASAQSPTRGRALPVMQSPSATQGSAQAPMQILTPQPGAARKPQHDPAYKVHLRLTADLKWFDITDADLRDWVRELHPDAYRRYRGNINAVIAKLETLRDLMDEAASHWKNLPPEDAPESR